MKKVLILFTLALLVVIPSLTIGRTRISDANDSEGNLYQIEFKEVLMPQEALAIVQQAGAYVVNFDHISSLGEESINGGYFPETQDQNLIIDEYRKSHIGFLQDMLNEKNNVIPDLDPKAKAAREQHLAQVEKELAKQDPFADVKIKSVIINGDEPAINQISKNPSVLEIQKVPSGTKKGLLRFFKKMWLNKPTQQIDYVNPATWMPHNGSSYLYPSSVGGRYVQQNMYWNSWYSISGFGTTSTYEHDFFLNNSDNQTYLSSAQYPNSVPIVNYWSSNLPNPYLDTRYGDSSSIKAYTIGCSYAYGIMPYQTYWYYIRTSNGNTNIDNGRLWGQLGYRYPTWCYSNTWCAWPDNSTPIQWLILPWYAPAPGTYNWTY